jgi:hypothetical protein
MSGALAEGSQETLSLSSGRSPSFSEPMEFPSDFGHYRLRGLLGRGGMGTVYDAEHSPTGRRVALKMLEQQLDSPAARQRFLREGRLAAGVSHPNSLYIFGSEEIDGHPVITMEIAGGGTLNDQLKRRGPFRVTEAVDAILDVIAGLEAAFAAGVLHRDIKPSNCFVSPDGTVKVGDFGLSVSTLARDDSYVTASGVIMGTPAFASPEQLRGDELDVRADIYSVGATLFTLLTGRAPFEGENAVQVVANAVNQKPTPLSELRDDIPTGLQQIVARCLAKEPSGRFDDYATLRDALLPFSSQEPEPASMAIRASAGWIDYLIAFLPPYIALMFLVGSQQLIVSPLVDPSLYSARFYFLLLGIGFLYFGVAEGIWGAGVGKWLKGLRVIRADSRRPGIIRALLRVIIPVAFVECVRFPVTMTFISQPDWTGTQTALFVVTAIICGCLPGLLALRARRDNGFMTLWDRASSTRVVIVQTGTARRAPESVPPYEDSREDAEWLGPYQLINTVSPDRWLVGMDPVLRRHVWLIRRSASSPSDSRQSVARAGRLRWLQAVCNDTTTWDVYEAPPGVPLSSLVAKGKGICWGTLRHWLHDLATELWAAASDQTLPAQLSIDQIWITNQGRAVIMDERWPDATPASPATSVADLAGQQQFLASVAALVEKTSLPLNARPALQNLQEGRFEKLSFLTGTLRGHLDRPAEVSRGIRAGCIFAIPFYVWIAIFVGRYHDKPWGDAPPGLVISALAALAGIALVQLLMIPFRCTPSQSIFRLAVINASGQLASRRQLLARWAVVWLPLFVPIVVVLLADLGTGLWFAAVWLLLWIASAVSAIVHPNRGWHDRVVGTWVVRR